MVRSDNNSLAQVGASEEGEEIDRIMREIEDLEKKMDTAPEQEGQAESTTPRASAESEHEPVEKESLVEDSQDTSKVVPMRPQVNPQVNRMMTDTLAETDAVPPRDEPLMRSDESAARDGGLSLKIGGCTEVNLEFVRAGVSVNLECSDDGLRITTDQGAEFRIPFKRTA